MDKRKRVSKDKLENYIKILQKMIDTKTIFNRDGLNDIEFKKFNDVIDESFPLIKQYSQKMIFGSGCLIYKIEGKNATKNIMLMSHHDVVDVSDKWETDPFKSVIKNNALYGRGSIDTKTPLFAELMAIEELLQEKYDFKGMNIYIGSSNNEEVGGDGMVLATKYFQENNIHFDIVLDEGGAITSGMIPGFNGKSAMVAVHEKSRHMYECKTKINTKGHGGLSNDDDSCILRLSKFINEVMDANIYSDKFYPEVKATFKTHAPYMKFPMNIVFSNLELFSPIIKKVMKNIGPARAMLSTSISFTNFFGGNILEPQIKAKEAKTTMFIRCIREEDMMLGFKKIEEIAKKYDVEINLIERDYCKPSSYETKAYNILKEVMNNNFKDVVVAPFLLTAGTDARRFSEIADNILRFAPIDLNSEQFKSIHGDNEHIYLDNVGECVCFYKDFILKVGEEYV